MSRAVDAGIAERLAEAAARGSCYVPEGQGDDVRRALVRRVARGDVVSPARGMFAETDTWLASKPPARALMIARGLQALHPDWVFCGPTAALAHGIDVSDALTGRTHLAVGARGCASGTPSLARHRLSSSDGEDPAFEQVAGLRVTPPDQTVFDCLRWSDFAHGLGVIDSALRLGLVGAEGIAEFIEGQRGLRRGVDRALATLAWADPRSENGGESIARGRMLLLGYARPELQVEVPRVVERGQPYRADYCWVRTDGAVILGELDGRVKYVEEELMGGRDIDDVISDENIRGSRFSLYDVSLVRFRFGVTERPGDFAALLDEYGVPKRGTPLALPDGVFVTPDWDRLRRRTGLR